jgi:predicted SprT family Zn-dependent metalloprotease
MICDIYSSMRKSTRSQSVRPAPPKEQAEPIIYGDHLTLTHWLMHYWQKLQIPVTELALLAMTQDRREFMRWTGKRLDTMALGCYCFIPARLRTEPSPHRHLIFVEPDMQPQSIEVTVAHELIHLADRVQGNPRRHRHHGYDAIAADEAAVTGYSLEELRALLRDESGKREAARRQRRPLRYLYVCPACGKQYPRTRRYSQPVSCSNCDKRYNARFRLQLAFADSVLQEG